MKERKHIITLQPFGYTIEIIFTDNIFKSRKEYDEFAGSPFEYCYGLKGLHTHNGECSKSVLFFYHASDVVTIAHESFHAVAAMYRYYDTPLKKATEEVFAYTLEHIISEVLTFKKLKA